MKYQLAGKLQSSKKGSNMYILSTIYGPVKIYLQDSKSSCGGGGWGIKGPFLYRFPFYAYHVVIVHQVFMKIIPLKWLLNQSQWLLSRLMMLHLPDNTKLQF